MTRTKTKTVDRKDRSEHICKPEHRAGDINTNHSNQETTKADQTNRENRDPDRSQHAESRSLRTKTDLMIQTADQGRLQKPQDRTEQIEAGREETALSKSTLPQEYNSRI